MSIFSKIKHGFEHLGHDIAHAAKDVGKDIEKVGKGIVHGVETVGKTVAEDALKVGETALQSADALMHGHIQQALNKALQAGEDLVKTGSDIGSAGTKVALNSLANMHLNKKMDHAMRKVDKGFDAIENDVQKSVDQVAEQVVSGTEGVIKGEVNAVKDVVHGKWGAAAGALGGSAMDALSVAADLTPEGAVAAVGTQVLVNAHIGNAQLDSAIGGALHGNLTQMAKNVVKDVAKTEIRDKVESKVASVASNLMPQDGGSGEGGALAAAGLGVAAGAMADGMRSPGSKRSLGGSGGGIQRFSLAGRSGKTSGPARKPAGAEQEETKSKKKEDADDNAQTAANNTVANQPGQASGSDEQLLGQAMLDNFIVQAGMTRHDDAQKRRTELTES